MFVTRAVSVHRATIGASALHRALGTNLAWRVGDANCHGLQNIQARHASTDKDSALQSAMKAVEYNRTSKNQQQAHHFTYEPLKEIMKDMVECAEKRAKSPYLSINDLGCAGGASSMILFEFILKHLREDLKENRDILISFEDLPSSDGNELIRTIDANKESLFNKYNAYPNVVGRSFYERLYPSNSIDLSLSYITLHWLSSADSLPKLADEGSQRNWVSIHERPDNNAGDRWSLVPESVFNAWKAASRDDLRVFLHHRAEELKDGAEGVYILVSRQSDDHFIEWHRVRMMSKAVDRFFEQGKISAELNEQFKNKMAIGYFLRTVDEIKSAFDESAPTEDVNAEALAKYDYEAQLPASVASLNDRLVLKDVKICTIGIGEGSGDVDGIFELFWSIHGTTMQMSCGATDEEMAVLKGAAREVHAEHIDADKGVYASYSYLRVQRKPRV